MSIFPCPHETILAGNIAGCTPGVVSPLLADLGCDGGGSCVENRNAVPHVRSQTQCQVHEGSRATNTSAHAAYDEEESQQRTTRVEQYITSCHYHNRNSFLIDKASHLTSMMDVACSRQRLGVA